MRSIKNLLIVIFCALGLSACGGLLIGATAGAALVYGGHSIASSSSDHSIELAIEKNAQKTLPDLKKQGRLVVAVQDGTVLLAGQVPTKKDAASIVDLAEKTKGVKLVYNEMTIGPKITTSTISHDAWITTKVKSDLLVAKGLESSKIKVVTENSVVYLMGTTTPKQADIAAKVASKVDGVSKVVTLFQRQP